MTVSDFDHPCAYRCISDLRQLIRKIRICMPDIHISVDVNLYADDTGVYTPTQQQTRGKRVTTRQITVSEDVKCVQQQV